MTEKEGALKFHYDEDRDILEIEGVKYAGALFRGMGWGLAPGQLFEMVKREEGYITITRHRGPLVAKAKAADEMAAYLRQIRDRSGNHSECPVGFCVERVAKEALAAYASANGGE